MAQEGGQAPQAFGEGGNPNIRVLLRAGPPFLFLFLFLLQFIIYIDI